MNRHSACRVSIADLIIGARFLRRLPSFLRHPIGPEDARAILRRRLERRETGFLALVRRAIYEHAGSPYRELLHLAGCEYGDLERMVGREGVEGALHILYRQGVYLTLDEFKGRQPVTRGGVTIPVNPRQLCNPLSVSHLPVRTSGSRSGGTPLVIDLAFVRDCAVDTFLTLTARGAVDWLRADWEVPGSAAIVVLLRLSSLGTPPVRWFCQVDPAAPGLHPRYRWSARVLYWGSRLAGIPLPTPVHVPVDDPLPIVHWMAGVLRAHRTPHLFTFSSPAVRLCEAAAASGIDLRGAQFTLDGEPTTGARLRVIRRTGAEAVPRYSTMECGPIGEGCLAPETPDDTHLLHDLHALIQVGANEEHAGLPPNALLVSSLRATAPLILLNVSLGDQATVKQRTCGCPLERLGWATHLHTIRSYEKLTAGGMTFLDTDLIPVLEEVLPMRFGGAPTDYQLVEEEAADGHPCVLLLVHPGVGPLDPRAVAEVFLTAISRGSGVERVMGLAWRNSDLLRVERRTPHTTSSGKILHLHQVPRVQVPGPAPHRDLR
jgi:hypothetical protein